MARLRSGARVIRGCWGTGTAGAHRPEVGFDCCLPRVRVDGGRLARQLVVFFLLLSVGEFTYLGGAVVFLFGGFFPQFSQLPSILLSVGGHVPYLCRVDVAVSDGWGVGSASVVCVNTLCRFALLILSEQGLHREISCLPFSVVVFFVGVMSNGSFASFDLMSRNVLHVVSSANWCFCRRTSSLFSCFC